MFKIVATANAELSDDGLSFLMQYMTSNCSLFPLGVLPLVVMVLGTLLEIMLHIEGM